MKKNYNIILLCSFLAVSAGCSKETPETAGADVSIVCEQENGKAAFASDSHIYWNASEDISVFKNTSHYKFTSINTEPSRSAIFVGNIPGYTKQDVLWALYPYDENAVCSGSTITSTLPEAQNAVEGTFDPKALISTGKSVEGTVAFKNVSGGIIFNLKSSDVTKISLRGKSGETLAGTFEMSFDSDSPAITSIKSPKSGVSLTAKTTFTAGSWYFISTLPAAMNNGFEIILENTAGQRATYSFKNPATIASNSFGRLKQVDDGLVFDDIVTGTSELSPATEAVYTVVDGRFVTPDNSIAVIDNGIALQESGSTYASLSFIYDLSKVKGTVGRYGLCWNKAGSPLYSDFHLSGPTVKTHPLGQDEVILTDLSSIRQSIPASVLEPGQKYYVRVFVMVNDQKWTYSPELCVTVPQQPEAYNMAQWTKSDITPSTWNEQIKSVAKVYQISNSSLKARGYYAVLDLASNKIGLKVNYTSKTLKTLNQQYADDTNKPLILINGGYFYGNETVCPVIKGRQWLYTAYSVTGSIRSGSGMDIEAESEKIYNTARAMLLINQDNTAEIAWNRGTFMYDYPVPSVVGEPSYSTSWYDFSHGGRTTNAIEGVGAGPVLVKDGKILIETSINPSIGKAEYYLNNFELIAYDIFNPTFNAQRTAVGITGDGKLIMVTMDGRLTNYPGLKLVEMAKLMKGLGCVDAMNFDGGGSTSMMVGGTLVFNGESTTRSGGTTRSISTNIGIYTK